MADFVDIGEGISGYAFFDQDSNELVTLQTNAPGTTQTNLRPATREEIEGAKRGYAARTASQKALGLAEQAAGGASFGLFSPESEEAKARAQVLALENPILKGTARVAGALAPAALTGGITGLGAGALGLGRTATGLATAAAEELAMATSLEMAAAAEEDRKVEVGNIAQGLLEGAAFLGATRFVGKLAGKAASKAAASADDIADSPAQALAIAQKKIAPTAEDIEKLSPTRKEALWYRDFKETVHDDINELAYQSGNKLHGRDGTASKAHGIGYKKQDIWGKMQDADVDAIADGAEAFADQLDELAVKINNPEFTSAPSAAAARSIAKQAEELRASVARDVEDVAVAFDGAKRHLDDLTTKFGSPATKGTDPLRSNSKLIEEILEPMREDLMDAGKWGKNWAGKQRQENALWSGKDGIINSRARWQAKLMEREVGAAKSYRSEFGDLPAFKMKGDDMVARVMSMGKRDRQELFAALDSDIKKTMEMNAIKKELGGPETRKAIAEAEWDLGAFKDAVDELKRIDRLETKWGNLIARGGKYQNDLIEQALENAPLTGAVSGGIPGAVMGIAAKAAKKKVLDALTDEIPESLSKARSVPELRMRALVNRRERAKGYRDYKTGPLDFDVNTAMKKMPAIVEGVTNSNALRRMDMAKRYTAHVAAETAAIQELDQNSKDETERAVLDLAIPEAYKGKVLPIGTRFQGEYKSLQDAYAAKMADLNRLIEDPEEFIARTTEAFQPLADAGHPELAAKLITRMQVGLRYLRENAPPTLGTNIFTPEGSGPDDIAILQFAPVWEAVWRPLDTVKDLSTRSATPSAIKALKEVHTDVYERVMVEVFKTLAAAGPSVDFETKRYIDNVFNLGPAVGRSFSPDMSNLLASDKKEGTGQASLPGNKNIAPTSAVDSFSKGPTNLR